MEAIRKRNIHPTKSKSTTQSHCTVDASIKRNHGKKMSGKRHCPYQFKQILKGFFGMMLLLLLLMYFIVRYELEPNLNVAFSSLKSSGNNNSKNNIGRDEDDLKAMASRIQTGVHPFVESTQSLSMTTSTATKNSSNSYEIEQDSFDSSKIIFYPIFDIQEHILQSFDEEIYKSKSIIQKIYNKKRTKFVSIQQATNNKKWNIRRQNLKHNEKNDLYVDPEIMERYHNHSVMIMTRKSYKGGLVQDQVNQDRAVVVMNPFLKSNDGMMIGIFDGHSQEGHIVAHVIQQTLPKILVQALSPILVKNSTITTIHNDTEGRDEQLKQAVKKSFTIADTNIPLEYGINAGCTTSLILQIDSHTIITANVGDSQSFVFQYNKSTQRTKIVYSTRKHKPDDPLERTRIERMGGKVSIPPVKEQILNGQRIEISSRVVIPKTNIGPVSLAMSRSSKFCVTLDCFLFR